jgi:hypothetical protein
MSIEDLPEDQERVQAYDRALRDNASAMLDEAQAVLERYQERGITTIQGSGWPLRPMFLSHKTLQGIATSLTRGFDQLRQQLIEKVTDIDWLAEQLPIPREMFENLDFLASLQSDEFLCYLRPDGFLYHDHFTLIEPNFGNGATISNAYTEIIYDYFAHSPVMKTLGWDCEAHLDRPFQGYLQMLQQRIPPGKKEPFVALFCHHWEFQVIKSWEERVVQQIYLAQQVMEQAGIKSRIVHEDAFFIDEHGQTFLKEDNQQVDCIAQFTIGTSFMDEPELFTDSLHHLRGPKVGDVSLVKPIACVCIDKGTMPLLATMPEWSQPGADGFPIHIPTTAYPERGLAAEYRLNKNNYVLKKSFDGKDTHVGISTHGRIWNRILHKALDGTDYVIQKYEAMPRTTMPMCFDGKHIEWVPVRVELSPFLVDGRYVGAIARYAPDAEGLIMSPPPENMGLTNVFSY